MPVQSTRTQQRRPWDPRGETVPPTTGRPIRGPQPESRGIGLGTAGLLPRHPNHTNSPVVPSTHEHQQIRRGDQPVGMARRLSARLPSGGGAGSTNDEVLIRDLQLYLADLARAWLEHLPAGRIRGWATLRATFICIFQGTCARPGKSWDLRRCQQRHAETLHKYIQCFSR